MRFYAFRNSFGRPVRVLSDFLCERKPELAERLSPVPPERLPEYTIAFGSPLHVRFTQRAAAGECGWIFYPARRAQVETIFLFRKGVWLSEKRVLSHPLKLFPHPYRQRALPPEPLTEGECAEDSIHSVDDIERYFREMLAAYPLGEDGLYPPHFDDAVPRNAIRTKSGELRFIDLEYEHKGGVRPSSLVHGAVLRLKKKLFPEAKGHRARLREVRAAYEDLCRRLGFVPRWHFDRYEAKLWKRFCFKPRFFLPNRLCPWDGSIDLDRH